MTATLSTELVKLPRHLLLFLLRKKVVGRIIGADMIAFQRGADSNRRPLGYERNRRRVHNPLKSL